MRTTVATRTKAMLIRNPMSKGGREFMEASDGIIGSEAR
jgi:hypothetical protein